MSRPILAVDVRRLALSTLGYDLRRAVRGPLTDATVEALSARLHRALSEGRTPYDDAPRAIAATSYRFTCRVAHTISWRTSPLPKQWTEMPPAHRAEMEAAVQERVRELGYEVLELRFVVADEGLRIELVVRDPVYAAQRSELLGQPATVQVDG